MSHSLPLTRVMFTLVPLLALGACATADKWASAGGSRETGVVRVAYEYPEFQQPDVSDLQAEELALNRCHAWGYRAAQPIAGQIRQCANMDDGNCNLWSVTREFQCTNTDGGYAAARFSR
jgi:hypothetical protein